MRRIEDRMARGQVIMLELHSGERISGVYEGETNAHVTVTVRGVRMKVPSAEIREHKQRVTS